MPAKPWTNKQITDLFNVILKLRTLSEAEKFF